MRKGKSPAQQLLKARILLKADVSDAGEGWSDSRIIEALETSPSMVYRVRKQLVEEGFEAVLSRKQRAAPAVAADFRRRERSQTDRLGLFATAQGTRALDLAVVGGESRRTRDRRSRQRLARSGGRSKKHSPAPSPTVLGHPAQGQQRVRSGDGRRAGRLHAAPRSRLPAGLPGRDLKATHRRDARRRSR